MSLDPPAEQNALLDACLEDLRADARSLGRRLRSLARLSEVNDADTIRRRTRCFVELEVAGSLQVGQLTAGRWLYEADRYVTTLPRTVAMLDAGELLVHQAQAVFYATQNCPAEIATAVEDEVLPDGAGLCPSDLRRLATRVLLRIESEHADAAAAEQRLADAAAERKTYARPLPDGMGLAGAVLTGEQLRTWQLGLDQLEKTEGIADRETGVERTADQRRADLFAALPAMVLGARAELAAWADLLAGAGAPADTADGAGAADVAGTGAGSRTAGPAGSEVVPWTPGSREVVPQVVLNVHVPMATVLDLSREPGSLDGYGPISAEHVRLLRPTLLRRVLVDELTGRPIHLDDRTVRLGRDRAQQEPDGSEPAEGDQATADQAGADQVELREQVLAMLRPEVVTDREEPQHDPSARLARLIDLRDVRCAGPGCGSTRNHRDHLQPWPAGRTSASNLGLLSERCHQAKHTGWTLLRHPDGSVTWTSPLGRTYQRPSPHAPPPTVDPGAQLPPLRPPPVGRVQRWLTTDNLTPPAPATPDPAAAAFEPPAAPALPDNPPF